MTRKTAASVTGNDGFASDEFAVNNDALNSILNDQGVKQEVASKAMRASVYFGPMRVVKGSKKKAATAASGYLAHGAFSAALV